MAVRRETLLMATADAPSTFGQLEQGDLFTFVRGGSVYKKGNYSWYRNQTTAQCFQTGGLAKVIKIATVHH